MSTSVDERIDDLMSAAQAAKKVRSKYPSAMWVRDDDMEFYVASECKPDALGCFVRSERAHVFVCDKIKSGTRESVVRQDACYAEPVERVFDFLREKHPKAYADLVRWVGGDDE
jgi:hypothetical protein